MTRMIGAFNPREYPTGFQREIVAVVDRYTPDEVDRATTKVVHTEDFMPKVATYLKTLDQERSRRSIPLDTGRSQTWEEDRMVLHAWVKGSGLPYDVRRRIRPVQESKDGVPYTTAHTLTPGVDTDAFIQEWIPAQCSKRALAAFCDDMVLARDERRKGEWDGITRLRTHLHDDMPPSASALTPTEKAEFIEREARG